MSLLRITLMCSPQYLRELSEQYPHPCKVWLPAALSPPLSPLFIFLSVPPHLCSQLFPLPVPFLRLLLAVSHSDFRWESAAIRVPPSVLCHLCSDVVQDTSHFFCFRFCLYPQTSSTKAGTVPLPFYPQSLAEPLRLRRGLSKFTKTTEKRVQFRISCKVLTVPLTLALNTNAICFPTASFSMKRKWTSTQEGKLKKMYTFPISIPSLPVLQGKLQVTQ